MPTFLESEGADDLTESHTCPFCDNRTISASSSTPKDHCHRRMIHRDGRRVPRGPLPAA